MRLTGRLALIALPFVFLSLPAAAVDVVAEDDPAVDTVDEVVDEVPSDIAWSPPAPDPTEKDWVRMSSGEWLKGSIEQIHDGDVKFDSDDLDDLELDWDDIVEIRSPRLHTYRFEGRQIVTGTLLMKDGAFKIDTGSEMLIFERWQFVSMMEGEPKEINFWSSKVSFGLSARSGNTDQADLNMAFRVVRRTALTRLLFDYNGTFSEVDGEETANSHRLDTGFDVYATRRFFVSVPAINVYRDPFQNIALRVTPGIGVGYDVFENGFFNWEVGGGLAYMYSEFVSVQPDEFKEAHDGAVFLSTRLELDVTSDVDWDTDYTLAYVPTDADQSNQHLKSVVSVDIWGPLDFETSFLWDWVNRPRERADGTTPESNDFRITVGLGLDL